MTVQWPINVVKNKETFYNAVDFLQICVQRRGFTSEAPACHFVFISKEWVRSRAGLVSY